MKRFLKTTLALAFVIGLATACSGQKEEPLYFEDGIVNLDGPWAADQMAFAEEDAHLAMATTSENK